MAPGQPTKSPLFYAGVASSDASRVSVVKNNSFWLMLNLFQLLTKLLRKSYFYVQS